jgi:hypothetical protein
MTTKAQVLFTGDGSQLERTLAQLSAKFQSFEKNLPTRAFDSLKGAAAGFLGGLSAGALVAFANKGAEAAARFQDLAEQTGASAVGIAGLTRAAAIGGTTVESLAGLMVKLQKGLAGADEETKGAAAAIQALGFNLAEFKKLRADEQFEAIAKRLAEFSDEGGGKAAFAVKALGRAGAEALPALKALAEEGGRFTKLTAEQIRVADEYADKNAKLRARFEELQQVIGIAAIPAITALKEAGIDAARAILGLGNAADDAGVGVEKFSDLAFDAAGAVATAAESIIGIVKLIRAVGGSFQAVAADVEFFSKVMREGFFGMASPEGRARIEAALNERERVVSEANQRYIDLWNYDGTAITKAINEAQRKAQDAAGGFGPGENPTPFKTRPKLNQDLFGGDDSSGKDKAKALFDQQFRLLERHIQAEQQLLQSREQSLQRYYRDDKLGLTDYYDTRLSIIQDALAKTLAAYDQEAAAAQKLLNSSKGKDRITAETKLQDILERRKAAEIAGNRTISEAEQDRIRDTEKYQEAVESLNAKLLEMQGRLVAASDIQQRLANKDARSRFTANGDAAALAALDQIESLQRSQKRFAEAQEQFNIAQQGAAAIETRINAARQRGAITTLESIAKIDAARKAEAARLSSVADAMEEVARATKDPQMLAAVDALRARIEELAASANELERVFSEVFEGAFADSLGDFITGTKSAKEAFNDFTRSVLNNISRIASQNIAEAMFGKSGPGGGVGSFFAGLFGGGGGSGYGPTLPNGMPVHHNGIDYVPRTGPAILQKGERVISAKDNAAAAMVGRIGRELGMQRARGF